MIKAQRNKISHNTKDLDYSDTYLLLCNIKKVFNSISSKKENSLSENKEDNLFEINKKIEKVRELKEKEK